LRAGTEAAFGFAKVLPGAVWLGALLPLAGGACPKQEIAAMVKRKAA
jgi:hypothetical protein